MFRGGVFKNCPTEVDQLKPFKGGGKYKNRERGNEQTAQEAAKEMADIASFYDTLLAISLKIADPEFCEDIAKQTLKGSGIPREDLLKRQLKIQSQIAVRVQKLREEGIIMSYDEMKPHALAMVGLSAEELDAAYKKFPSILAEWRENNQK